MPTYIYIIREFGKELDRALGEKQGLQMEIEEQKAAMKEFEMREAKMRLEAKQKEEEIKVTYLQCQKLYYKL